MGDREGRDGGREGGRKGGGREMAKWEGWGKRGSGEIMERESMGGMQWGI